MKTLSQILVETSSYLDLTAALPTGDDLSVRINYAQQAMDEWAAAYNWRQLNGVYNVQASMMSVSMPSNFRRFNGPVHTPDNGSDNEYPEILPEERWNKSTSDKYCYLLGSPAAGYTAVFNNLSIGASLSIDFQRYPSNMMTFSDLCEADDGEYVKQKVISYVLQSRSDDRFPLVDADANRMLQNMIGREMIRRPGGSLSTTKRGTANYGLGLGRQGRR
jgi:hypothetical protein